MIISIDAEKKFDTIYDTQNPLLTNKTLSKMGIKEGTLRE